MFLIRLLRNIFSFHQFSINLAWRYDFMDKILKIHDFFDLHSLFSFHEKIFYWKFGPKFPLGGSKKPLKIGKKTRFLTFLIFYLENAKWHSFFYIIFPFHIGWAIWKKNQPILSVQKKKIVASFCKAFLKNQQFS